MMLNEKDIAKAWERMAEQTNVLLKSKLKEPLTGADLVWISLVIQRNGGKLPTTLKIQDSTYVHPEMREAFNGSP